MGQHNNYYAKVDNAKVCFLPFQSQDPSPPLTDFHIRFQIFWKLKKNENNSEKCERESDCLVQLTYCGY